MILKIQALPHQIKFAYSKAKYPALVGGFGCGKTQAITLRALHLAARDRTQIAVYLPTFDLVREIALPRFDAILEENKIPNKINWSKPSIILGKANQPFSRILFRTLDKPERIIGYEVGHSLVDELDTLPTDKAEHAWQKILGRNRLKLPKGRINTVGVGTTPEGFRFVYEKWKKPDPPLEGFELIQAKTMDNPFLPPDYVDSLAQQYPEALLKAYLEGEFVNLTDSMVQPDMFRPFDRAKLPYRLSKPVMFVDLAISKKDTADYTAFVVMASDDQGFYYVLHAEHQRLSFKETYDRIVELSQEYDPLRIGIESVQYQVAIADELIRTTDLPITKVKPFADKIQRFTPLAARYEQRRVFHLDFPQLREYESELVAFPNGAHDDFVDAAAGAYQLLKKTTQPPATPSEPKTPKRRPLFKFW